MTLNKKLKLIPAGTVKAGDLPGHPFRGNQWTDGEGGGTGTVGHAQRMGPLGGSPMHTTRAERRQKTREKLTRHDNWSANEYNTLTAQGLTDKEILTKWDKEAADLRQFNEDEFGELENPGDEDFENPIDGDGHPLAGSPLTWPKTDTSAFNNNAAEAAPDEPWRSKQKKKKKTRSSNSPFSFTP